VPSSADDASLAILAGGKARRMGGLPKGLLLHDGRPILAHLLALGPRFADTFLVSSDPLPYARFGVRSVADVVPDRGAPGGVQAALAHARTPWVLVVAADMPFVTPAVVDLLLAERGAEVEAVGFEIEGRLEPLLACYRSALAPRWADALRASPSLQALWRTVRTRVLPAEALARVDPHCRAVVSVNTEADARAWKIALPPASE
jgi:molybdopterin-guanine dinucleotide biosynthesis protein A